MKSRLQSLGWIFLAALMMWFFIAQIVFAFRHSWMTSTERLIWIKSAMQFRKVSFHEVRP